MCVFVRRCVCVSVFARSCVCGGRFGVRRRERSSVYRYLVVSASFSSTFFWYVAETEMVPNTLIILWPKQKFPIMEAGQQPAKRNK